MNRFIFNIIGIILCVAMFTGCNGDDDVDMVAPSISEFSPIKGSVTDRVTITGKDFGSSRLEVDGRVYFNGIEAADYISWNNNQIIATVPQGYITGHIGVKCNGKTASTPTVFTYMSSNPDDMYEHGTFSKFLMCADVVEFTGSCNPCDYVDDTGKGTVLGQMGKDPTYKGNAKAGSFSLWDSKPGDYTIFKFDIETEGKYYVSFLTATQISNSFVNVAISTDLASLQNNISYDNKNSRDIELSTWATYLGPIEMGSYLLKKPGTYYIRFLMMNSNMIESAVATLSLIKVFN